jgi:ribosomal protein L12E/L44/L45/RPP1/RPP2
VAKLINFFIFLFNLEVLFMKTLISLFVGLFAISSFATEAQKAPVAAPAVTAPAATAAAPAKAEAKKEEKKVEAKK